MIPVVVAIAFILWKYANVSDSSDPNLGCRISGKVIALLVSGILETIEAQRGLII